MRGPLRASKGVAQGLRETRIAGRIIRSGTRCIGRARSARRVRTRRDKDALALQQRRDTGDITAGFEGKRAPSGKPGLVASRSRIIGCKKASCTVAVIHFSQVRCAREDIVTRLERIASERVPAALARPGAGHELHQSHRACRRHCARPARTFNADHGIDPVLGNAEALRGLAHMRCNIDRSRVRLRCARLPARVQRIGKCHCSQSRG